MADGVKRVIYVRVGLTVVWGSPGCGVNFVASSIYFN